MVELSIVELSNVELQTVEPFVTEEPLVTVVLSFTEEPSFTVDPPSTGLAVYTNYAELQLEESADLIIESGDVVPDVFDLFLS